MNLMDFIEYSYTQNVDSNIVSENVDRLLDSKKKAVGI